MTVNITIIGLGKIGTSVGLALKKHKDSVSRFGHDVRLDFARRAHKLGAIDKAVFNLPASVSGADLILLAIPIDQVEETLTHIVPDLKDGAVVMDTCPSKQAVTAWAEKILPDHAHYVGLTPIINSEYLEDRTHGPDSGKADLFEKGLIGITAPQRAASDAIKLAADLTKLLGASPLFMDTVEADSLAATTHIFPQLVSAALAGATIDKPGWQEGRKLAGVNYAQATLTLEIGDTPEAVSQAAILSSAHMVRNLDNLIGVLQFVRTEIANGNREMLEKWLKRVHEARDKWWIQRQSADWAVEQEPDIEMPTMGDSLKRMVSIKRPDKEK